MTQRVKRILKAGEDLSYFACTSLVALILFRKPRETWNDLMVDERGSPTLISNAR